VALACAVGASVGACGDAFVVGAPTAGAGGHAATTTSVGGGAGAGGGSAGGTSGAGGATSSGGAGGATSSGGAGGATSSGGAGGATSSGGAGGATSSGGAGGSSPGDAGPDASPDPCVGVLGGVSFAGHCYVDISVGTATFAEARAACEALGVVLGRTADVPVLGSADEEAFVTATFLEATKLTHDAWLGLTCDLVAHPDVGDCFCPGGCADPATQLTKLAAWSWINGDPSAYRNWSSAGPNGDGRCSAVRWGDATFVWGDRDCATNQMAGRPYRTLCELE
jgi:hypothetical protein